MRRSTFLRALLALPVAMPLAVSPLTRSGIELGGLLPLLGVALIVGGVPYLVFAAASLWLLRGANDETFRKFLVVSPLWYLVPLNAGIAIILVFGGEVIPDGWWYSFLYYSGFGLGVGYFYVVVGLLAYRAADRLGWFGARRITSP